MRRTSLNLLVVAVVVAAAVTACQWPRDPEGTLDRVRGGVLNVGVVDAPPWAESGGATPRGAEVELVNRLARQVGARVDWTEGSESEVVAALEHRAVDLAVGGLANDDPWSDKVTFSRVYLTTRALVAVPPEAGPPESIEGVDVAVERDAELIGLVREQDGVPKIVSDVGSARGPAAVPDWELGDLGFEETDVVLHETEHVLAVRHGENAWLSTVESFLLDQDPAELMDLLAEADR